MSAESTTKRTISLSSFGGNTQKEHELQYDWSYDGKDIGVQGGGSGVVFSKDGNYKTAFFEAFPDKPSCFVRGEGETIADAEKDAWERYQKILVCDHEMERRDRRDGYGFCKHCSYSSMVFEPLNKCCKCGIPTRFDNDHRNNWYCKKHAQNKPKNPNPSSWEKHLDKRIPRKLKKKFKEAFHHDLYYRFGSAKMSDIRLKKGTFKLETKSHRVLMWSIKLMENYTKQVLRNKRAYAKFMKRHNQKLYVSKAL